jgi:hypothetical protein
MIVLITLLHYEQQYQKQEKALQRLINMKT